MSDLWGPIDIDSWQETPCIQGRSATEDDINSGIAVFYIPAGSKPFTMNLPAYALLAPESPEGDHEPVIVIQAEIDNDRVVLGARPLTGGNVVCMYEDVDFTAAPPE